MATQVYTDGVTLTAAAEFNRFDTASYPVFSGVTGTNTVAATGPANYALSSTNPLSILIPAFTNTSTVTINVTPSGGAALGAKAVFYKGAACAGGELVAGVPVSVAYDGTQFNVIGSPGVIKGTTTNDSAAAGQVGQKIEATALSAAAVSLTNSASANVTSMLLTAGDWDVHGNVVFQAAGGTTPTILQGWISTASATPPTAPNEGAETVLQLAFAAGGANAFPVGEKRISSATTTTVYLSVYAEFGVSTMTAYGYIGARRRR